MAAMMKATAAAHESFQRSPRAVGSIWARLAERTLKSGRTIKGAKVVVTTNLFQPTQLFCCAMALRKQR
jgi:hypothetical protein